MINWVNIIEFNAEYLDANMLTKAYLRRGLAYERNDNYVKAREDFRMVKQYDPTNKAASDALHRVRPSDEEMKDI